jgi:hypothetical protein
MAQEHHTARFALPTVAATALALAFTTAMAQAAHTAPITVPGDLRASLVEDAPNHPFLLGNAKGTQNYSCTTRVDAAGAPILDAERPLNEGAVEPGGTNARLRVLAACLRWTSRLCSVAGCEGFTSRSAQLRPH